MDQLFEKLANLTLGTKPSAEEEPSSSTFKINTFVKTGLLNYKNQPDFFQTLIKNNGLDAKCMPIEGRDLNEKETEIYQNENFTDEFKFLSMNPENGELIKTDAFKSTLASVLELTDKIINDDINNGVAFLNSETSSYILTVLLRFCIQKHNTKRILVVNWDTEHDSVIQEEFYDHQRVLYISMHRHEHGSDGSDFIRIGENSAKGFNINIPLKPGFGDTEYMAIFLNVLLPVVYEFGPQLVIVPTCFNANSPKGEMNVSPIIYEHFMNYLTSTANGKICLLLNDKNKDESFTSCVNSVLNGLLGYPCRRLQMLEQPKQSLVDSLLNVISIQRPYWYSLQLLNENDDVTLEAYLEDYQKKNSDKVKEIDSKSEVNDKKLDIALSQLNISTFKQRSCICSDEFMTKHLNLIAPNHPENPDRVTRIIAKLKDHGLYEQCEELPSRKATDEELKLCHTENYIAELKTYKSKSMDELIECSKNVHSVYYHWDTFECATLAAGCLLNVLDNVCTKKSSNGVGVIRPPGHHASSELSSGFCFFNSVAVAARYAQKNYESIKKVLILDFDVHHGDGTQDIFKNDESVLFISLHRYDNGCFYPAQAESNYNNIGYGKGRGFTVNVPWNQPTAGDSEYIAAFLRVVMPVAYQFNPDLVLISAGFDAAIGDPLGGFNVSPNGFAQMTKMMSYLADGKVIMALEGGYNLTSISESLSSCVAVLLGDTCPSLPPINAKPQAYKSIQNVISVIKEHWNCFQFDRKLPSAEFFKKQKKTKPTLDPNGIVSSPSRLYTLRNRTLTKSNETNSAEKPSPRSAKKAVPTPTKKQLESKVRENLTSKLEMAAAPPVEKIETCTPFAIVPITNCPHLPQIRSTRGVRSKFNARGSCLTCSDSSENWICLTCHEIQCSRYVKNHMVDHYEKHKHPMVLSFSDISVWCYECDSYVHNDMLSDVKQIAYDSKFAEKSN